MSWLWSCDRVCGSLDGAPPYNHYHTDSGSKLGHIEMLWLRFSIVEGSGDGSSVFFCCLWLNNTARHFKTACETMHNMQQKHFKHATFCQMTSLCVFNPILCIKSLLAVWLNNESKSWCHVGTDSLVVSVQQRNCAHGGPSSIPISRSFADPAPLSPLDAFLSSLYCSNKSPLKSRCHVRGFSVSLVVIWP